MRTHPTTRPLCVALAVTACGLAFGQTEPAEPATRPADPTAEAALMDAAGKPMDVHRTEHFLIATDAPAPLVDELKTELEKTFRAASELCRRLGLSVRTPDDAMKVLFFDKSEDYVRFAREFIALPESTYGLYVQETGKSAFLNVQNHPEISRLSDDIRTSRDNLGRITAVLGETTDADAHVTIELPDGRELHMSQREAEQYVRDIGLQLEYLDRQLDAYLARINQTVLAHETAHQVLDHMGVYPHDWDAHRWIVEGLACLLESVPNETDAASIPPNPLRMADFRRALAGPDDTVEMSPDLLVQAMAEQRVPSLERVLTEPRIFEPGGHYAAEAYATAWALTAFLADTQPEPLGRYMESLREDRPEPDANNRSAMQKFEQFFGQIDEAFVRRWGTYLFGANRRSAD